MFKLIILLLFFINTSDIIIVFGDDTTVADSWMVFTKETNFIWKKCAENNTLSIWSCLKNESLEIFDKISTCDVIPITQNMRFVKNNEYKFQTYVEQYFLKTDDKSNNNNNNNNNYNKMKENAGDADSMWSKQVLQKISNILKTYAIQIDLRPSTLSLVETVPSTIPSADIETSRHRRRHQMLPMMIFGVTALGMIMVPLGFQFLAVLGGKALLLSKMALLLASINGLKRVASSGVHYGLYHTPTEYHYGGGGGGAIYWDRSVDHHNQPRHLNTNN